MVVPPNGIIVIVISVIILCCAHQKLKEKHNYNLSSAVMSRPTYPARSLDDFSLDKLSR